MPRTQRGNGDIERYGAGDYFDDRDRWYRDSRSERDDRENRGFRTGDRDFGYGYGRNRRRDDEAEDNWTGRSRGNEYRQEDDDESMPRYGRGPRRDYEVSASDRDSERWGYGRRRSMSEGRYQTPVNYPEQLGPGFADRGQYSPMGRYGQDYNRQSFEGYGQRGNEERNRSLVGLGPKNYRRSDERIKEDVCEALTASPWIDASETDVEVKQGIVTLSGSVGDRRDRQMMEDLVESLPGVKDVEMQLKIERKGTKAGAMGTGDTETERGQERGQKSGQTGSTQTSAGQGTKGH